MSSDLKEARSKMQKTLDFLHHEYSKMRVGRASTAMIEDLKVEVYGSQMTVKEVAALSVTDSRTVTIQPWDRSVIADIERGLLAANLGITPMNDGKVIRIILPPLTEERRKDYVKQIKAQGEDAKVSIRGTRRETIDAAKKEEIAEDELKRFQDQVQKITDEFSKEIDHAVEAKSKELMSI